ncbi:hypothetical protein M404DRAFT_229970 [Pisolithus tinctorius Marx 270]|uniref:Uncharacterized protein n=1 Tax=Pisolithus tinctorius Marx 270 TaxID=870435 RepID=A0A0C3PMK2_PISTI|nr:hypothetical protein M404DRAFT_229970 [Pisolithus tinctorius Marx 270]
MAAPSHPATVARPIYSLTPTRNLARIFTASMQERRGKSYFTTAGSTSASAREHSRHSKTTGQVAKSQAPRNSAFQRRRRPRRMTPPAPPSLPKCHPCSRSPLIPKQSLRYLPPIPWFTPHNKARTLTLSTVMRYLHSQEAFSHQRLLPLSPGRPQMLSRHSTPTSHHNLPGCFLAQHIHIEMARGCLVLTSRLR